jgi:hypothetical protein
MCGTLYTASKTARQYTTLPKVCLGGEWSGARMHFGALSVVTAAQEPAHPSWDPRHCPR